MHKRYFTGHGGVRLAYLDFGGTGQPILALHGHFGRAIHFAALARALAPQWRLIALEQRGHGVSSAYGDFSRTAYVSDAALAIEHLGIGPAVVYGHSLGGVNAYQLAARRPELVRGLVIEDIGAVVTADFSFLDDWPVRFESIAEAVAFFGKAIFWLESLVEHDDGWGFRFRYDEMQRSQAQLSGDWWPDWLGSTCPTLLLHGGKSWALKTAHAEEMAQRRLNTQLQIFPNAGHAVRDDAPEAVVAAIQDFLGSV